MIRLTSHSENSKVILTLHVNWGDINIDDIIGMDFNTLYSYRTFLLMFDNNGAINQGNRISGNYINALIQIAQVIY